MRSRAHTYQYIICVCEGEVIEGEERERRAGEGGKGWWRRE